ncbi:Dipeptide transport system permease protein DppC [Thioalkalivibrio nitratireducens DSM 14787]|uniref:Dipeptide transport system permease protein DppC n=1 Tax=Thioalkalivibrio nitratireducens (strain DSM 14787 / UNIQEM 213 / ALEN2) TaxID=1255043 RepID=L0E052_THIND|nr:ABC transporter permease [Thioalkalivibrio nitratireducens]AGA34001.1 Dipeptide transport system permease protein DppC [Thioalkalivibrio nitratireducens DSM 14787]
MRPILEGLRQLARYPSALVGLLIIAALVGTAVFTVVTIPYGQALELWRGGEVWRMHPVNARPVWVDRIAGGDLPRTQVISSRDAATDHEPFEGGSRVRIPLEFDYAHKGFPSELNLFLTSEFAEREPFVRLTWETPDGREFILGGRRLARDERISISQDWGLERRLGRVPHVGLFAEPGAEDVPEALPGRYRLVLDAIVFEEQATIDADLVVYGRVHGLAGTDHQRRDLMVALLWGIPVALAFGLLAAVGTTVTTLVIAAAGVWYGGWVDAVIQRLTEVNIILPLLPVLVMVGTLYSTSIWVMLGVVIALGIFSAGIKMYRAMLLPIREAPYIEAARAYGAGNARIVLRYMIPRILPVLIPTFVTLIPSFVFLEASLALLGLGDPVLPTWGKVMNDAQTQSALYHGFYYWVLSPAALLMLTGLGFAMLGFALDRVFNPRLRAM